ncbi:MAG: hypothetical protein AAGI88_09580 [Pseudomonadota bacterium]
MSNSTDSLNHFATTVQKSVSKATILEPREEIIDASVEYCVSSGYVLISEATAKRALVTHISNVVLELSAAD